ncbi:hypothetical protein GGP41_004308 [Bipolaris sorokiniana]|uniref:Uncharacterized protein n=2 Tax=Cochliobolus sativus TaxID=45130 RepID=A0A8H6DXK7_COCSA|nr:uncharacterized protein COCSADRAFT_95957 [Bipolaris sorokiniana ND90Pr]EMD61721.1 hypothetical protein COCSADRAFT_95957 [Bipolaris sorokiniana ND90Pr]KAF5851523.1 hypothetical protein GGP41_004308 [Bipolaris sorokiniana]
MLPYLNGCNTSILAIPIHFIISMMPHAVARAIAARARLPTENSSNLRAQDTKAQLKQRVPAESYVRYMRMCGCYHTGMEASLERGLITVISHLIRWQSFPLFVAAVVIGNMAGLAQDVLNAFAVSFLAVRLACTMSCLLTVTSVASHVRGALWVTGVWMCLPIFVRAAVVMSDRKTKEVHRAM